MDKATIKALIRLNQDSIPVALKPRAQQLPFLEQKIVTVVGARRCGKSTLMAQTANQLVENGIDVRRILWLDFDDERFVGMTSDQLDLIIEAYRELFPDIQLADCIMFFDEIQVVEHWELFVMRLYKHYCRNIYISGSNATMLSSELNTALRGWPDEFKAYPLSFAEFCSFNNIDVNSQLEADKALVNNALTEFLSHGGFPQVVLTQPCTGKLKILQSYFETMLLRDLGQHFSVANTLALRYLLKRVLDNLTKPTSANRIYNDMRSQGFKLSKDDLYRWIDYACSIFLLMPLQKWSKSLGNSQRALKKYYSIDTGLRNAVLKPQSADNGKNLENAVFLHLLRQLDYGDQLFYYSDKCECDFVLQQGIEITRAVQVCWELDQPATLEREINGLMAVSDQIGCNEFWIVTHERTDTIHLNGRTVHVIAAVDLFLGRTGI